MADSNNILITLSALVILSYLYNIIAKYVKIPSVILLLATGVGLKILGDQFAIQLSGVPFFLNLFGDIGLIKQVSGGTDVFLLTCNNISFDVGSIISGV